MTVLEVLQASTDYFKKRNVESARLNAEHLLAHALGCKRIELYLEFDRALTEQELAPLRDLVRQRGEGRPLQHLLGTTEFCGLTFICDKRALVPRPETEELVELLVSRCSESNGTTDLNILDVGTGSGVIALSLAAKLPKARVQGIDVSEEALTLARENADRLGLSDRVNFQKGNLLENVQDHFDLIAANLPYVGQNERDALSREVLHDPEVALFGGEQGYELIEKLINQAADRLVRQGLVALEIGASQRDAVVSAFTQKKYKDIEAKTDYSGTPRFVFARYG